MLNFRTSLVHPFLSAIIFLMVWLFCFTYWGMHDDSQCLALCSENAIIQILTNYFYYAGIAVILFMMIKRRTLWPVLTIMILFCLREQDLHKIYHGISFLKVHYYSNPEIPMSFKILGLIMIVALGVFALYLLTYAVPLWKKLRARHIWAITATLAMAALYISKSFDGMNRTLAVFHMHEDDALPTLLEETLELILPVLITLATIQFVIAKDTFLSWKLPIRHRTR